MSQEPPTRAVPGAGPPAGVADPGQGLVHDGFGVGGGAGVESAEDTGGFGNGSVPLGGDGTGGDGPGPGGDGPGGEEPGGQEGATGRPRRKARRWITEWVVIILVAVGVAFTVRTYVAQTYYVPSTSMYPTLKAGDRIVVNKLYGTIHTGDIIVFKRPPAEDCGGPPVPDLVKRVIGLPGQTVSASGGQVYITGKLLKEPWLPKEPTGKPLPSTYTTMTGSVKVPKGDYYVMGDNRVDSCDSRMWGPVKASYVVGKMFLILWPPSQWRFF